MSNRSRAYLELHMPLAAMQDAQQALQLDPNFVKAYHRLAAAYTSLGRCTPCIPCIPLHPLHPPRPRRLCRLCRLLPRASV